MPSAGFSGSLPRQFHRAARERGDDQTSPRAQSEHELLRDEHQTGQRPADHEHIGEAAFGLRPAPSDCSARCTRGAKLHDVV
ncbi:hypothetical protein MFUR16E_20395 [Methylobacterium fujisawaense]